MVIEIKKEDSPEDIERKLRDFSGKINEDKKKRLSKFFGILKIQEDPVKLQRRWRDEW